MLPSAFDDYRHCGQLLADYCLYDYRTTIYPAVSTILSFERATHFEPVQSTWYLPGPCIYEWHLERKHTIQTPLCVTLRTFHLDHSAQ
jgi:hypothetical protein